VTETPQGTTDRAISDVQQNRLSPPRETFQTDVQRQTYENARAAEEKRQSGS
jgi:hypothetical protein